MFFSNLNRRSDVVWTQSQIANRNARSVCFRLCRYSMFRTSVMRFNNTPRRRAKKCSSIHRSKRVFQCPLRLRCSNTVKLSCQPRTQFGLVKFENIVRKQALVYVSNVLCRTGLDARKIRAIAEILSVIIRAIVSPSSPVAVRSKAFRPEISQQRRHVIASLETCTFRVSEFTATEPLPADGVTHYPIVEYGTYPVVFGTRVTKATCKR